MVLSKIGLGDQGQGLCRGIESRSLAIPETLSLGKEVGSIEFAPFLETRGLRGRRAVLTS